MARYHHITHRAIAKNVNKGREIPLQCLVSKYLGYNNLSREWLIEHTTDLACLLYLNNNISMCVFILDGTYVYTCGSCNHAHQRKLYSGQKRRHLFKIIKIVAADGSIFDTFGPFPGIMNDAEIIKNIFDRTNIASLLNGDVVLVDRGFRGSVTSLQNKGLIVKIAEFVERGTKGQLTTKKGNVSRL